MSCSIGSTPASQYTQAVQSQSQPSKPAAAKTEMPQDTVTLSAAAQKALAGGGDLDHDGDSQ
jgi:hypothetical protein